MASSPRPILIACLFTLSASGCFIDRSGTGTDDGEADGGMDAGTDGGRSDGGPDAGPVDAGPVDSGPGDDGAVDGGLDAGVDSGTDAGFDSGFDSGFDAGPPSCDALYGAAPGYIACTPSAIDECEFFTMHPTTASCTSICATLGGTCIRRWRDAAGAGNECVHLDSTSRACGTTGNTTDICVCTR